MGGNHKRYDFNTDVWPYSVVVLKALLIDSETFKTLAELLNYLQTTMTKTWVIKNMLF